MITARLRPLALLVFSIFSAIAVVLNTNLVIYAQQAEKLQAAHNLATFLVASGEVSQGEVLVKYKNQDEIKTLKTENITGKLQQLMVQNSVEIAQPNFIYRTTAWTDELGGTATRPDDYNVSNHWYYTLENLKQAWKEQGCPANPACGGSPDVVVAVIDTGLAFETYDDTAGLSGVEFPGSSEYSGINLFTNSAEIADNGIDEDCNGYTDDVHGADTYAAILVGTDTCEEGTPREDLSFDYRKAGHPNDNYGHGSIVTGNIASVVDNGAGSASPAFNTTILPIASNFYFSNAFSTSSVIRGLIYASAMDADIVNMSLGGTGNDSLFRNAIENAYDDGVMLIASSGNNGGSFNPTLPLYPAHYPEVISVGAVNQDGTRSYYTSYGTSLDVSAFVGQSGGAGGAVWQTTLDCYNVCDDINIDNGISQHYSIGTSFASPQVAALAALLMAKYPSYTNKEIAQLIFAGAGDLGTPGYDTIYGYGAIDFRKSLNISLPTTDKVYRFWSASKQSHFYTMNRYERDLVIYQNQAQHWAFERDAFSGTKLSNCSGGSLFPVYRFWSEVYQTHFYTISAAEKTHLENNHADIWSYEVQSFCAYKTAQPGTQPLYRFWSAEKLSHFFTISEAEKNFIIANYPTSTWNFEGVAFYTQP